MVRTLYASKMVSLALTGVICLAVPSGATAGSLGYRNDTEGPVIVQGMSIIRGVLRAGKRHVLQPGDVGWDQIVAPGNKLIIVSDAKQPTKVLYQGTIQFLGNTQFYSIKPFQAPKKNDKDGNPKKSGTQKPANGNKVDFESTTPPPVAKSTPMPRR
jgi:hypothetical protein